MCGLELYKQRQNYYFLVEFKSRERLKLLIVTKTQLSLCVNLLFVLRTEGTLDSTGRICGPVLKLPMRKKENMTNVLPLASSIEKHNSIYRFNSFYTQRFYPKNSIIVRCISKVFCAVPDCLVFF